MDLEEFYLDACAIRSNSCLFLTDGELESLFAARINCSAKCSSIGFGLENVASLIASDINFKAKSTLRIGATSTDTWYTVPP